MKKLIFTCLTILTCGAAYALPVGNPCDASLLTDGLFCEGKCVNFCDPCASWCDAFSFRIGFYGDYVFNRHMEVDTLESDANIENTEIYTNAGFLALNLWNRLDIFATLGATNIYLETNANAFAGGPAATRLVVETDSGFSWSLGARATLWEWKCFCLGAEGQYFFTHPDIRRITVADSNSIYNDNLLDAKYREWQIGVGISASLPFFCESSIHPYLAVKWARANMKFDYAFFVFDELGTSGNLYPLESERNWGYAIGVTLVDFCKASVTVEGRFLDEKAVYVNGQVRF